MRKEELGRVNGRASLMEAFSYRPTPRIHDPMLCFFAKILPKIEKRWVKPGKNGEISGSDESL